MPSPLPRPSGSPVLTVYGVSPLQSHHPSSQSFQGLGSAGEIEETYSPGWPQTHGSEYRNYMSRPDAFLLMLCAPFVPANSSASLPLSHTPSSPSCSQYLSIGFPKAGYLPFLALTSMHTIACFGVTVGLPFLHHMTVSPIIRDLGCFCLLQYSKSRHTEIAESVLVRLNHR